MTNKPEMFFKVLLCMAFLLTGFAINAESSQETEKSPQYDIRYRSILYFEKDVQLKASESLGRYMTGFEQAKKLPRLVNVPTVAVTFDKNVTENYPPMPPEYLSYFGRGLSKAQADILQDSKLVLVIDVAYPINNSLEYYKATNEFLYDLASDFDAIIFDSETRETFSVSEWKNRRVDNWSNGYPNVETHTIIHAYNNGPGIRAITLGMAKFGAPDIVINDFSWSVNNAMGNLLLFISQSMVEGLTPEKKTLALDVDTVQNADIKSSLIQNMFDNSERQLKLRYKKAQWEEGDPDNYLIEVDFDAESGGTLGEKQESLISRIFGWHDSISYVRHDDAVLAASQRAKNKLNDLRKDFNAGLEPGEYIQVKAPFETSEGGNEWMWVEILTWKDDKITGLLKNEPFHVPDLRAGATVHVNQEDVFDYIRTFADGREEGNETAILLQQQQQE